MQNVFWLALQKLVLKRFVVFFKNTVISPRFRYKPLRLYNLLKPLNKMYKRRLNNKRQLTVCSSLGHNTSLRRIFGAEGEQTEGDFPDLYMLDLLLCIPTCHPADIFLCQISKFQDHMQCDTHPGMPAYRC